LTRHAGLEELTKTIGLTINTRKTKVIIQPRIYLIRQQMEIQDIEAVDVNDVGTELTRPNEEEV